jgi:hypothetical protein
MGNHLWESLIQYDLFCIISAAGIVILLVTLIIFKRWMIYGVESYLNMVGYTCMMFFLLHLLYQGKNSSLVREYFNEKLSMLLFLGFLIVNISFMFYHAFFKFFKWDELEILMDMGIYYKRKRREEL